MAIGVINVSMVCGVCTQFTSTERSIRIEQMTFGFLVAVSDDDGTASSRTVGIDGLEYARSRRFRSDLR